MHRLANICALSALTAILLPGGTFTPLEWQQRVSQHCYLTGSHQSSLLPTANES
ncbi:MAG: hypothetical protein HY820_35835 [Acidobacteria bacterium]|nr:hypothetical protein [Acidobacteriota bacterium]